MRTEQKSLAQIEYIIKRYSNPGDIVADCFAETGTTLEAFLITSRVAYGCEIDGTCFR